MRVRSKKAKARREAQAHLRTILDNAATGARTGSATVAERVTPVASAARDRAVLVTKDRVVPAVRNAAEHAGPALEKGYTQAREKAAPVVAQGRDRLVDDVLPKLAEAVAAASATATAARDHALENAHEQAAAVERHLPSAKKARRTRRRRFVVFTVLAAAAGGAVVAWRAHRANQQDPWAPDPATDAEQDPTDPAAGDPITSDAKPE